MKHWQPASRNSIAQRVAGDIKPGAVINLGIGLPELVGNYLSKDDEIIIHTENGIIGSGPTLEAPFQDFDLINAGRKPVSLAVGGHFVDHVDSFALVRGGHLDITILGAFQVSARGDLANWSMGNSAALPSPGGAMDLAIGARRVFAVMSLFDKAGNPKLLSECTLPLTAAGVVTKLYTDIAVFELSSLAPPIVHDLAQGVELNELKELLQMELTAAPEGIRSYGEEHRIA